MRAHGSPFLRIEVLLALLAFPLYTAGCGPRLVWGIPADELSARLAKCEYATLAQVDLASQDPGEAFSLSPEAPFYLSFVFDTIDRPAQSLPMLEAAWSRSPSPWKEEAGVLLAQRYVSQKDYGKAIDVTRRLLASVGFSNLEQRARRVLVEALYWNREDAAALEEAARLAAPDPEVLLFRAVGSLRLGLDTARGLMLRLFIRERTSALHGRAYAFLAAEPAFLALFSAEEQGLMTAKNAFVQADWARGIALMESTLGSLDPARFADGALVVDLGNAYGYAGREAAGAKFMEKLAVRLTGQARADALEQSGRLFRRIKDFPKALALLEAAAGASPSAAQRDRAYWFLLDVRIAQNGSGLTRWIESEAASWSDPGYFSDLLEKKIADWVTGKRWSTLAGLWKALESAGPDDIRAQLSYVLARAWQEGEAALLPGTPPLSARDLFLDAIGRDPMGYYGIMSASILGQLPDRAVPAAATDSAATDSMVSDSTASDSTASGVALDPVVMGFIPFGLTSQAYARLWAMRESLSDAELLEAARRLARAGDTRSSMYLVGALRRRRRLTVPELQQYYPKAFAGIIDPLAAATGIPDHILYGLVREESYFDADIVSSAGAIGLSQLMPATAAAVARGLRMTNPDLRDPATNLTIGARHLEALLSNVDSPTKALLSYNAGMTRLRQWERASRGLPVDLFVESVPIAETREYVRKILVSSVMYAFLYKDADPREAALSFFNMQRRTLDMPSRPPSRGPARPN